MAGYDAIVLGVGGIGSAALGCLARRKLRVLGLDRYEPGHDRGSSHGQTRIIRQAYFEHPDYVPLLLQAYAGWHELEARMAQRLYFEVGLLQVGPADGIVVPGVLASAREHGLEIELLNAPQIAARFPGFRPRAQMQGVFECRAGYLLVEECVRAQAADALAAGAELRTAAAINWRIIGSGGVEVETEEGRYCADRLIITAGAWANQLLADLRLPLAVIRKPVYWYATTSDVYHSERGCPAYLFEAPEGIFYGFPQLGPDGIKVGEHTGGIPVDDPLALDRRIDRTDQVRVEKFLTEYLPAAGGICKRHSACMYTLSPDGHFIVDHDPQSERVVFAAGLSGHGFKFAPVLGEALAQLAIDGTTSLPVGFLSAARFRGGS
ncbi:MAG TPA: N-methyl-L-tryptophan oxidase [Pirellulales bacterium]|jgi:sarcosine oxidase|nr:N-methyl-L-tryptophan oxidase [Pirellulales bacterium]